MWIWDRLSEEGREQFEHNLNKIPADASPDEVAASPAFDMTNAGEDFMAQLNARGGAGRLAVDGVRNVEVGGG